MALVVDGRLTVLKCGVSAYASYLNYTHFFREDSFHLAFAELES